jgi:hypothetical protein
MEVHFSPEQQAKLTQIATKAGTAPERLVANVVARYLDEEARFLAAVDQPSAASLSKKRKWTLALKPCLNPDAHPLDRTGRRRFTGYQGLSAANHAHLDRRRSSKLFLSRNKKNTTAENGNHTQYRW